MPPAGPKGATNEDSRTRPARPTAHPFLAVLLDGERPLAFPSRHDLRECSLVELGRGTEREIVRTGQAPLVTLKLVLPDGWMSSSHARLSREMGRWVLEDLGSRNGCRVNGVAQKRVSLTHGDLIEMGRTWLLYQELVASDGTADLKGGEQGAPAPGLETFLPSLQANFAELVRVARSGLTILVRGEPGAGREVIARAVHQLSGRTGPFVVATCGALPRGGAATAFVGTARSPGLVARARGGTLLLDGIEAMRAEEQSAVARLLDQPEVRPEDADRAEVVDLRLVGSETTGDGPSASGALRDRCAGYVLDMPPLRDRRIDLGLLVADILQRLAGSMAGRIALEPEAARALLSHRWPGNIRELQRCLETAVVLSEGGRIALEHLPAAVREARPERAAQAQPLSDADSKRREEIAALLESHGGNVSAVARAMGKARMQVQRWLKRYGIDPRGFKR
jgi:DNA-binding NtrC family response regulator